MKKLLTLLLFVFGMLFTHYLSAQTTSQKTSADTSSAKKSDAGKVSDAPSGGSSITIDESGTSKPKHKKKNAAKKDDDGKESAQKADEASPAAPAEIAIDESGPSKPHPKPKASVSTGTDPPSSDSTIIAPANQVGRPQR